jgi:hypothetical protein
VQAKEKNEIIPKGIAIFSEEPTEASRIERISRIKLGPNGEGLKVAKLPSNFDDDYDDDVNQGKEDTKDCTKNKE